MYLLDTFLYTFGEIPSPLPVCFPHGVVCCGAAGVLHVFWILNPYHRHDFRSFLLSPVCWLPFRSIVSFETQNGELKTSLSFFPLVLMLWMLSPLLTPVSRRFIPGFSFKCLVAFVLTLRCWSILRCFVHGVRCGLPPHASTGGSPAVPAPLVKGTVLSHWLDFGILVSSQRAMAGCICSLSSIPMCSPSYARTTVLDFDSIG